MKILQLTAENIKRLKVVDIAAEPGINQITGKNGSGKTSVLDSIWSALAGAKNVQAVPIRKGCEEAKVRLNLGELIVIRTFRASGTTSLEIFNAIGAPAGTPDRKLPRYGSPQDMLNALLGELSFDPLAFARMEPRQQCNELRRIADLPIDIDALEAANAEDYKCRTDLNRDAKAKRAQAAGIIIPQDLPTEFVDESVLLDSLQAATIHNGTIEALKNKQRDYEQRATEKKAEAKSFRQQADTEQQRGDQEAERLRRQLEDSVQATRARVSKLRLAAEQSDRASAENENAHAATVIPEELDLSEIRKNLTAARQTNELIRDRKRRDAILTEAAVVEMQAEDLTRAMARREKQKAEAIAATKMPIEGLGFGVGIVTFNGLPFDQASDAERLRVSVAIAMAKNPKLRVIRIRDGSLLDEDALRALADTARERDYQIWIERVDSSGKIGIVMEDGQVKETNATTK